MAAVKPIKLMDLGSGQGALKEFEAGDQLNMALNEAATLTIASAATTDVGAALANTALISGAAVIAALGTAPAGSKRTVRFSGTATLTHNATALILPGAADITSAANDSAEFLSLGSGNWFCLRYTRANGRALVATAPAWGNITGTLSAQTDLQAALSALGNRATALETATPLVEIVFDGTATPPTIISQTGKVAVTSVTRSATGTYSINFAAPIASAINKIIGLAAITVQSGGTIVATVNYTTSTTSKVDVLTFSYSGGTNTNAAIVAVAIFALP